MNRLAALVVTAAVVALPLFAADPKKNAKPADAPKSEAKAQTPAKGSSTEEGKAQTATATVTATVGSDPKPAVPKAKVLDDGSGNAAASRQQDSPLVAAAKRSGRNSGKSTRPVITNETLATDKTPVHLTTTTQMGELPKAPQKTLAEINAEQAAARKKAEEAEARKKGEQARTADEQRKRRLAATDHAAGDPYDSEDVDPARAEQRAQDLAAESSQANGSAPQQNQKPPQR